MPEFGSRRKVDLAIQSRGETVLLELKTFPTNYGAGGKPITNFIDSVIADLEKLSEERGGGTGLAAWLAYPIPEPPPSQWSDHLARVEAHARATLRSERISLFGSNEFAHLTVMESK